MAAEQHKHFGASGLAFGSCDDGKSDGGATCNGAASAWQVSRCVRRVYASV